MIRKPMELLATPDKRVATLTAAVRPSKSSPGRYRCHLVVVREGKPVAQVADIRLEMN